MHPFPVPPVRPLSPPLPKWWRAAPSEVGGLAFTDGHWRGNPSVKAVPRGDWWRKTAGGARSGGRRLAAAAGTGGDWWRKAAGGARSGGGRLVGRGGSAGGSSDGGGGRAAARAAGFPGRWRHSRPPWPWRRRTATSRPVSWLSILWPHGCPQDTRRKQKLLLTQLRVLCQLLGVIESPGPHLAPLAPCEAGALAQARERWRELKAECEEVLGGALPSALTRLRKGQCLLQRLQGALEASLQQKEELKAELREALERREQLRGRVAEQRRERLSRQEALRHCQEAALRAEASCRLYQMLTGGAGGCPPPRGAL
ncbi:ZW10 interactor isoform X1 [Falco naumanni]|uniref:ZW10 interactor isoform X1 n=1 Tax=Falco naumanni TaxID=148594 RepID=UPI001ADDFEA3|nr:ZW10 interactor isoform X1 [Falco naumanni]